MEKVLKAELIIASVNILRYVGAHNMHNFKNDGQMEISNFPRFLIKMLNYIILDHIYLERKKFIFILHCRLSFSLCYMISRVSLCTKLLQLFPPPKADSCDPM